MRRRTKALQIPPAVKRAVHDRDGGLCILCGRPGDPVAHYISRAQGGLGIAENVVTLCGGCHTATTIRQISHGFYHTAAICTVFITQCLSPDFYL